MTKRGLPSLFQSKVPVLPGPPQNKINDLARSLATLATAIGDSRLTVPSDGSGAVRETEMSAFCSKVRAKTKSAARSKRPLGAHQLGHHT